MNHRFMLTSLTIITRFTVREVSYISRNLLSLIYGRNCLLLVATTCTERPDKLTRHDFRLWRTVSSLGEMSRSLLWPRRVCAKRCEAWVRGDCREREKVSRGAINKNIAHVVFLTDIICISFLTRIQAASTKLNATKLHVLVIANRLHF